MLAILAVSRLRRPLLVSAAALVLSLVVAADAGAYVKPPGGSWQFNNLFDDTERGALSLSRAGTQVTKLVLVPGERRAEACGTAAVRMTSRPKIRSYASVNGRYAVASLPGRLFRPTPAWFSRGGRRVRGKVLLLWDHDGRLMDTGEVELPGGCRLGFFARKGR